MKKSFQDIPADDSPPVPAVWPNRFSGAVTAPEYGLKRAHPDNRNETAMIYMYLSDFITLCFFGFFGFLIFVVKFLEYDIE